MDLETFRWRFRTALEDTSVSAIVLDVDSPGGSASGIEESFSMLYEARGEKPVVAVANTLMASGALWLAAAADKIVASPSALLGSVGVRWIHLDVSEANRKAGLELTTVKSAGAPNKDEFSPDGTLRPEDRRRAQELADGFHQKFVGDVARGRRLSTAKVNADFGRGRLLSAKETLAAGMVDEVANFDVAVAQAPGVRPQRNFRVELEHCQLRQAVRVAEVAGDPHAIVGAESRLHDFQAQHS